MSTFPGRPAELPNISIDEFEGDNLRSSCFFLSHCHSDHMRGLNAYFVDLLVKKPDLILYCSPISRLILLNDKCLKYPEAQIVDLTSITSIEVPPSSSVPVSYKVTVTPIPAGHCPGSVMFLFETAQETVLYTGDFRIAKGDVCKFKQLHSSKNVKRIDKLYFDSTFLSKNYWEFPSRQESLKVTSSFIKQWLEKDPRNIINIKTSATYGSEYLFLELARMFNCKVYVEDHIWQKFWYVPEIGSSLTNKPDETRIYVCKKEHLPNVDYKFIFCIKPCAMSFNSTEGSKNSEIYHKASSRFVRVCFATHSSCSELIDFLSYLKPKKLEACTSVWGLTEKEKGEFIDELKASWQKEENEIQVEMIRFPTSAGLNEAAHAPLKIRIPTTDETRHNSELDSPPRRRKRLPIS